MNPESGGVSPLFEKLKLWSSYLVIAISIAGCLVLVGWQFDITFLKKPLPTSPAMNPLTAVSFILASLSFLLSNYSPQHKWKRHLGMALAVMVMAIGGLRLINVFSYSTFEIDKIL
jgi:hypothetical protein